MDAGRQVLGDRYELIALVATGGMGQVWRGRDTLLNRPVAVKVLRSEFTGDPTFVARFRAEAQHTAVVTHRNIATLFDYGEVPQTDGGERLAYLVMELVEGESLSDLLARERTLDPRRTLDILRQTASALGAAHAAGLVHRDVKPGNVLVGVDGVVKITDFGIAWSASSVPLTQTGQVVGTAYYLSPEQAAGAKATPASDVYALGMIGYECLTGRRAFEGESPVQIALMQIRDTPAPLPADVPDNLRTLIGRALLKDPAARFPDGAAFLDAVHDVLAGRDLPPLAPAAGTTTPLSALGSRNPATPPPPPRRRLSRRSLAPLAALVAGAGLAVGALQVLGDAAVPTTVAAADTATQEPSSAAPTTVLVRSEDFLGRPVGDVEAELAALGFAVERIPRETAAVAADRVTDLSPAGRLVPGTRITVTYAVAPPPQPEPAAPRASVPQEIATTSVVPGPDPAPASDPAPAPARGAQPPTGGDDAVDGDPVGGDDAIGDDDPVGADEGEVDQDEVEVDQGGNEGKGDKGNGNKGQGNGGKGNGKD